MNKLYATLIALITASLSLVGTNSLADTIFSQDIENGLGPNESVVGSWSINDTNASNSGSFPMPPDANMQPAAEDSQAGQRVTVETLFIYFHDDLNPPLFRTAARPYPLWDPQVGGSGGHGDRSDFTIRSVGQINIRQPGGLVTLVCNSDDGFSLRIDDTEIGSAPARVRGNTAMEVELSPEPPSFTALKSIPSPKRDREGGIPNPEMGWHPDERIGSLRF